MYLVMVSEMNSTNKAMSTTSHAAPIARNAGCDLAHGMSYNSVLTIPVP